MKEKNGRRDGQKQKGKKVRVSENMEILLFAAMDPSLNRTPQIKLPQG